VVKGFMLYDALGISNERATEITKRTLATFQECNEDMLKLCKAVAEKHDPEAVLIGALIEKICSANDEFHAMDEKTTRRRRLN